MDGRWLLPLTPAAIGWECGVEQEYQLHRGARQLDFRELLPSLTCGLVPRDPGDPRAHRLPHGAGLTADGWEAELVTAPEPLTTEGLTAVAASLRRSEAELAAQLPGVRLSGFSTHLNVSVPDDAAVDVAHQLARTCLGAIDALVRPAERTGWLIRPRRSRIEVGTDFLDPARALLGLALVAAGVHALVEGDVPPDGASAALVPSREKFGWFASPIALAPPSAALVTWLDGHVRRLGLPPVRPARPAHYATLADRLPPPVADHDPAPRRRGTTTWACTWLTWRLAAWCAHDEATGRRAYAVLPAGSEPQFLALLDAGVLDDQLARVLRSPLRRVLLTHSQTGRPALWSDVRPGALVPAERGADGSATVPTRRAARRDWRHHKRTEHYVRRELEA